MTASTVFKLCWADGIETFDDERTRSSRAWQLHAAGQCTAEWIESTLAIAVRLADDEVVIWSWFAALGSLTESLRAAHPAAISYSFPDADGDYCEWFAA